METANAHADQSPMHRRAARSWLDTLGAWASGLCAVHCVALPLAVAALPSAGLAGLDSPAFDRVFVVCVAIFGLLVISSGVCLQRIRLVSAIYLSAVALLVAGAFALVHGPLHAVVLSLGGASMAAAHLVNRGGVHRHGEASNIWLAGLRRAKYVEALRSLAKSQFPGFALVLGMVVSINVMADPSGRVVGRVIAADRNSVVVKLWMNNDPARCTLCAITREVHYGSRWQATMFRVADRRNAQRPLLTVRLWDVDPPHRLRAVRLLFQGLRQFA